MQLHRPIPVHAISFNCAEQAANEFLCKLAQLTRGRFHFYSDQAMPGPGPEAWEVGGERERGSGWGEGEGRGGGEEGE